MKVKEKPSAEVYSRLNYCLERLFPILSEEATIDSTMILIRDDKNSWQLQLKLTKDEFDFLRKNHGEVVMKTAKRKKKP